MRATRWIIALSGASGMRYGIRLVEEASHHVDEVHVIVSEAALRVLQEEEGLKLSSSRVGRDSLFPRARENLVIHNPRDIAAAPASGSFHFEGMVVVPCSMATLGAIANGIPSNLVHRAADVTLKEGRRLILVPRETPLSAIHLENMLTLTRLGCRMAPAMPGFYHQPKSVDDIVDMMVMKIMDQMGIESDLVERWSGSRRGGEESVVRLYQNHE